MSWWKSEEETAETGRENTSQQETTTKSSPAAAKTTTPAGGTTPERSTATPEMDLDKRYGTVRSALSNGTVIQGKLSFDTPVRIDGNLMGEVFSSSVLIVGPEGSISADINVDTLVVLGSVSGEIKARKRLELHSSGEVVGSVETPSLLIQDGAFFDGSCSMGPVKEATKEKETEKGAKVEVPIVKAAANRKSKDSTGGSRVVGESVLGKKESSSSNGKSGETSTKSTEQKPAVH